jgi:hypothetical protein
MSDRIQDLLNIRARDARRLSAFYLGKTDDHPHGLSGRDRVFLPAAEDKRCLDTSPGGWRFSEWGNGAGIC